MKNTFKAALVGGFLAVSPVAALASGGAHYEKAPIDVTDVASVQRGAQIFMNYCLTCHSASAMRYNRLMDLGLTEDQIKNNLIFTGRKIGDTMVASMTKSDAVAWFGVNPPDLSVIARSKGADYLYAYLRGFYQDPTRATGWNNLYFDKVGMPHVLWEQSGIRRVELDDKNMPVMVDDGHGNMVPKLKWVRGGLHTTLSGDNQADTTEYDAYVRDLTNYLVWMGEPGQTKRRQIGYIVLLFLFAVMLPLTYLLKKEYWKDVEH